MLDAAAFRLAIKSSTNTKEKPKQLRARSLECDSSANTHEGRWSIGAFKIFILMYSPFRFCIFRSYRRCPILTSGTCVQANALFTMAIAGAISQRKGPHQIYVQIRMRAADTLYNSSSNSNRFAVAVAHPVPTNVPFGAKNFTEADVVVNESTF